MIAALEWLEKWVCDTHFKRPDHPKWSAARVCTFQDPLGLLPDWANLAYPTDPLSGLLPRDPLAGLLPAMPTPAAPGLPGSGGAPANAPGPSLPADIKVPQPGKAPDCQCDPATRRLTSQGGGPGGTTAYHYGALGLRTRMESPAGVTQFRYDEKGNLLGRADPGQSEVTFTYDDRGRLAAETDLAGNTTTYIYEDAPHGRPARADGPLDKVETRQYNDLGLLAAVADASEEAGMASLALYLCSPVVRLT